MGDSCERSCGQVTAMTWHPTSPSLLLFGCADGTLGVLNAQTSAVTKALIKHRGPVTTISWCRVPPGDLQLRGSPVSRGPDAASWRSQEVDPDGPLLVSLCSEGVVLMWRMGPTAAPQGPARGPRRSRGSAPGPPGLVPQAVSLGTLPSASPITALATAPDPGDRIRMALGHMDGTIGILRLLAPGVWEEEGSLRWWAPGGSVMQLAWSSVAGQDRFRLAAVLQDSTVVVQAVPCGTSEPSLGAAAVLGISVESVGHAQALAWNPRDPGELAVGTAKGVVQVWAPPTLGEICLSLFQS
jgi:hypothetical protein